MVNIDINKFLSNLAYQLATDLLKALAGKTRDKLFGDQEQRELKDVFRTAFEVMLNNTAAELNDTMQIHLVTLLQEFVKDPEVAEQLINFALSAEELNLEQLYKRFEKAGYDPSTITIDFNMIMTSLVEGLSKGFRKVASRPKSALSNKVILARLEALHKKLEQEALNLKEVIHESIKEEPSSAKSLPDQKMVEAYLRAVIDKPTENLLDESDISGEGIELEPKFYPRFVIPYRSKNKKVTKKEERDSLLNLLLDEFRIRKKEMSRALGFVVENNPKLILLGEPGIGKTTSLQYLARISAEKALNGKDPIPIYAELKTYRGEHLEAWLAERLEKMIRRFNLSLGNNATERIQMMDSWLRKSEVGFILLLDGLNEVPADYHSKILDELKNWLQYRYRIVITCREHDYDKSLKSLAIAFVLQGLDESEIRNYLSHCLGSKGEYLFDQQIRYDKKMLTLAANPLMLKFIKVVAQGDPEAQLPVNRGKLIQNFVRMMPKLRLEEGVRARVPLDVVTTSLSKIGFKMLEQGVVEVELAELRNWHIPTVNWKLEEVLVQAKDWRFIKSDGILGEPVEFIHQLFLEYFAATYLALKLQKGSSYSELLDRRISSSDWLLSYSLSGYWGGWDEVVTMLAGIYEDPEGLIKWLAYNSQQQQNYKEAFLAYRCWEKSDAVNSIDARTSVIKALVHVLHNDEDKYARMDAARILGRISDRNVIHALIYSLQKDKDVGVRQMATEMLGIIGDPSAFEYLITALLHDPDIRVRYEAAEALGRLRDPRAVKYLIAALQDKVEIIMDEFSLDEDEINVPEIAAWALGQIADPKAIEPLIASLSHRNPNVRWGAAEALGEIGDERALRKLERIEQHDRSKTLFGEEVAFAASAAADKIWERVWKSIGVQIPPPRNVEEDEDDRTKKNRHKKKYPRYLMDR